jgi:hypothetical protein
VRQPDPVLSWRLTETLLRGRGLLNIHDRAVGIWAGAAPGRRGIHRIPRPQRRRPWPHSRRCAFSKHYPPGNYVLGALSDSLNLMAGWVLRWLSGVRTRLRERRDLLLEFIVLHHQLAVLQRTGTRRPCFRPSERLFWVLLSPWWANWQRGLIIVQPATVLRWRRRSFWAIWGSGSCGRRPSSPSPAPLHGENPRPPSFGARSLY